MRIGVTGHIWASEPAGVRPAVRRTLDRLGSGRTLVVVSALAAGADRLVAEEALQAGARLEVVLPFAVADYEQDFADTVAGFRALLSRAASVEVLPGDPAPGPDRDAAYAAAGGAVVARCEVLLAIWDGEPARGVGGTGQIVPEAVAAGFPVVWVSPEGRVRLLPPDHPDRDLAEVLGLSAAD